jgi:hypothetical protein
MGTGSGYINGAQTATVTSSSVLDFTIASGLTITGLSSGVVWVQGMEPAGGLIQVRDEGAGSPTHNMGVRAGDKGLEIDVDNNTGVDDHGVGNTVGVGNGGLIVVSKGNNAVDFGMHIQASSPATFIDGITVNSGCCTGTAINDYSQAAIGLNINNPHATAAINLASGVGNIVMNSNAITNIGSASFAGSSGVTTLVAASSAGGTLTLPTT